MNSAVAKFSFTILSFVLLMGLTGCSSYSKNYCEEIDWHQLGYDLGSRGDKKEAELSLYNKECGDSHGVQPDRAKFDAGFDEGLKAFCTPQRALSYGEAGGKYAGQCKGASESEIVMMNNLGLTKFEKTKLATDIASLKNEVARLKSELARKDSEISALKSREQRRRRF